VPVRLGPGGVFCFTGKEVPELRKEKRSGGFIDGKESFSDMELKLCGSVAFLNVCRCCELRRVALCPGAFAETSTSPGQALRAQLTGWPLCTPQRLAGIEAAVTTPWREATSPATAEGMVLRSTLSGFCSSRSSALQDRNAEFTSI